MRYMRYAPEGRRSLRLRQAQESHGALGIGFWILDFGLVTFRELRSSISVIQQSDLSRKFLGAESPGVPISAVYISNHNAVVRAC